MIPFLSLPHRTDCASYLITDMEWVNSRAVAYRIYMLYVESDRVVGHKTNTYPLLLSSCQQLTRIPIFAERISRNGRTFALRKFRFVCIKIHFFPVELNFTRYHLAPIGRQVEQFRRQGCK